MKTKILDNLNLTVNLTSFRYLKTFLISLVVINVCDFFK